MYKVIFLPISIIIPNVIKFYREFTETKLQFLEKHKVSGTGMKKVVATGLEPTTTEFMNVNSTI